MAISKRKAAKSSTLCSSAAFYKQVIEIEKQLKRRGFRVKMPMTANEMKKKGDFNTETFKPWLVDGANYERKTFLTQHHFKKVASADAILVLNYRKNGIDGYIGGAVLAEMAVALHFKKPIYVLNPIPKDLNYSEELFGMQPIILNGDFSKLKS